MLKKNFRPSVKDKVNNVTVANLYPELPPGEREEAEYRLLRYLTVVRRIFERIARERPEILPELEKYATVRKKRENTRF